MFTAREMARRQLMSITQRIAPCLWFNDQAEQAAAFYVAVFKNSKVSGSQSAHTSSGLVNHRRRNVDQIDIHR